jgi:hypothetical protein
MTVAALAAVGALAYLVSSVVGTAERDVGTPDLTERLHIERPADAVCVDPATDRATMLNSVMEGDYGPIGEWQSADSATAIQLGPDQWLFIMGDSTIGPNDGRVLPAAGYRFINNSVILQDGNCFWGVWRGKDTGEPARSLFLAPDGDFYWPSDGYFYGGRLVIGLHQGLVTDGGGIVGFEITDRDFVVVDISDGITGSLEFERGEIIDRGPWDDTALGMISGQFLDADPTIFNQAMVVLERVPLGGRRHRGGGHRP